MTDNKLNNNLTKLRFLDENGEMFPDWEEKRLKIVGTFHRGNGMPKADITSGGKYDCVHYGELFSSPIVFTPVNRTNYDGIKFNTGTILMPSSDVTPDGLAKASVIQKNNVVVGGDTNVIIPDENNDSVFISQMIRHQKGKIIREVVGTTVKHIYPKNLQTIKYDFPSLPEQEKISTLLSKMDEKIEEQEKLVELLKEQKQGYMQRLIGGGNRRLRFKKDDGTDYDDWEEKKLGEVAECLDSKRIPLNSNERNGISGNIPYYGSTSIQDYINKYIFNEELVLLGEDAAPFYDFKIKPIAQYVNEKCWVNNHVHVLRVKDNAKFLFYSLVHKDVTEFVSSKVRGKLNQANMKKIVINLPSLPEQEKIAEFLSSLDNRISEQEKVLEKLKNQKNGYMQKVLG